MSSSRPGKIRILENRCDYLLTVVEHEPVEKRKHWMLAELQALQWALPILRSYMKGDMMVRRSLGTTQKDENEEVGERKQEEDGKQQEQVPVPPDDGNKEN